MGKVIETLGLPQVDDQMMAGEPQAVALDKNFHEAWSNLGKIYFNKGDYTEAITIFEKALRANLNHADTYKSLALSYKQLGNQEKFIEYMERARISEKK